MMQRRFDSALDRALRRAAKRAEVRGLLGLADGTLYAETDRSNYVYARLQLPTGVVEREVYCAKVAPVCNLPVIVRQNTRGVWEVMEEDAEFAPDFWGSAGVSGNAGRHGSLHYWGSLDPTWVDLRQVTALRVYPTDPTSLIVNVGGCLYRYGGQWKALGDTTFDLTSLVPAASGQRLVIVGLDRATNVVAVVSGTVDFSYDPTLWYATSDIAALLNTGADGAFKPAAAVRLYAGQTTIEAYDVFSSCQLPGGQLQESDVPPVSLEMRAGEAHGTLGVTLTTLILTDFTYAVWSYPNTATQGTVWVVALPDKPFTSCTLTLHWTASGGTAGQNVLWRAVHHTAGDGDPLDVAGVTETFDQDTLLAAGDDHVISKALDVAAWTPGELLTLKIQRHPAGETVSLAADALLLSAVLEFS